MNKYITRKIASVEACRFTPDDVRRINNRPEMSACTCLEWLDGFTSWIESAYDNKATSYEEMAIIFNKNTSRKFAKSDGKIISYCHVFEEYLSFMCLAENYGKHYTVSRFKNFVSKQYREVYA